MKEKQCLRSLEKFQTTITELVKRFVSNDDDLQNIEIEIPPPSVMETTGMQLVT